MSLSELFKKRGKLVALLYRNKADFYYKEPIKNSRVHLLGSVDYGSENAQFGNVYNQQNLTKELANFIRSRGLKSYDACVILSEDLLFTGNNEDLIKYVPLNKEEFTVVKPKDSTVKTVRGYNNLFVHAINQAFTDTGGKVGEIFAPEAGTSELEFAGKVMYNKGLSALKLTI